MKAFFGGLRELRRYPSAIAGLAIILLLAFLAVYAMVAIPYSEAIRLWRGGEGVWDDAPRTAWPKWINLFRTRKLPETIIADTRKGTPKSVKDLGDGIRQMETRLAFDYPYEEFPSEVTLFLEATKFHERRPHVTLRWRQPNGREIALEPQSPGIKDRFTISTDEKLRESLGRSPEEGLFAEPGGDTPKILPGKYELLVEAYLFEPDSDLDLKLVVYGKVHGMAGTDDQRRSLSIALLWGTPIALAFGLLAAVGTTLTSLFISATGSWFGGRLDAVIQRITEVNAMLPSLTILIMIGIFFNRSIWVMLVAIILLSMFGLSIKTYRSIFLSLKEAPYIEAARAYGASNSRIIFRYMIPKVIPMLIPAFVTAIPGFVFLEASLSVLGLGDPVLPTWGKLLNDASNALYQGHYYWVLEPAFLLVLTGFGFAMLGFALDRIFNPRLREQ